MIVLSLCMCLVGPALAPAASVAPPDPGAVLAPLAPRLQDRGKPKAPSAEAVAAMVERLRTALKGKETAATLEAIRAATSVPHADVAKALELGLKAAAPEVVRGSLEALGGMDSPDALKRLLAYAKRERKRLDKDPEQHVLVIKSIALHDDPNTLDFFLDRLFTANTSDVVKARLLSAGRLRHRDTVEALIQEMQRGDRRRIKNHMRWFQVALAQLTGQDLGKNQDRWTAWWKTVDKKWAVTPKAPLMPEELQRIWDGYWGNMRKYERETEREKRGQGDGR